MTDFQKLELANRRRSLIDAHLFIILFRCLLVVAVSVRLLGQTHLRSWCEQLCLFYVSIRIWVKYWLKWGCGSRKLITMISVKRRKLSVSR